MTAQPDSPNALWEKHGYTVERQQRHTGGQKVRTIRNPQGETVLHDVGYDAELEWIRENLEASA